MLKNQKSYIGKAYIYDLRSKKILCEGFGCFNFSKKNLDVSIVQEAVYQNANWVTILKTEDGYFAPAIIHRTDIVPLAFQSAKNKMYDMSSYFKWPLSRGIEYISVSFNDAKFYVKAAPERSFSISSDHLHSKLIVEANSKLLAEFEQKDLSVHANSSFSGNIAELNAQVIFSIANKKGFRIDKWRDFVNSFRLYWLLQHDHIDCQLLEFRIGEVSVITDLLSFSGLGTDANPRKKEFYPTQDLDLRLLSRVVSYFFSDELGKDHKKAKDAALRFMRVRFMSGPRFIEEDALAFVASLDGFSTTFAKSIKRDSAEKNEIKKSIEKVLKYVQSNEGKLHKEVFDFYSGDSNQIYGLLTKRPFKESVILSFKELNVDFESFETNVDRLNTVRQIFVHGKAYDSHDVMKELYTQSTHEITEDEAAKTLEIVFGKKDGLLDGCYQMLKVLYGAYFRKV